MKKLSIITIILFFLLQNIFAQLTLPEPSPGGMLKQKVGFTDITFSYSRPSAKGRKIFGNLVPYNELWRTGAGEATLFKITDNIKIQDQSLPKGTYSFFTIPTNTEWTLIFNKDTTLHGTSGYSDSLEVIRIKVSSQALEKYYETFTINILNIKNGIADIALNWENTEVKFQIDSKSDEKVIDEINRRIVQNKENNPGLYYQAALYYLDNNKDLKFAENLIEKAILADKDVKYIILQARIFKKQGRKNDALKMANKALEMANDKNLKNYIKMSKELVIEIESTK